MRAHTLLFLAATGCATVRPAPTPSEEARITPEETAAWEAAWEENEAARVADAPRAAPPPPAPAPAAAAPAPAPPRPVAAKPSPGVPADATVAAVVLHTPAGDMEVRCPNVCPPGHSCLTPREPCPTCESGGGVREAGVDLVKEVLTPLAAAIGGIIAGWFGSKKRKKT